MRIEPAWIEKTEWSIFDSNLSFYKPDEIINCIEAIENEVDVVWITLKPAIDKNYFLYNPKALVILFMN